MYSEEAVGELLQCPICIEQYTNPKSLPCGHVLCYSCILGLTRGADTVRCPVCRSVHPVPEEGVEGFPDNYVIKNLISLPVEIKLCPDCETSPAVTMCQHCDEKLCCDCRVHHTLTKSQIQESTLFVQNLLSSNESSVSRRKEHGLTLLKNLEKNTMEADENFKQAYASLKRRERNFKKSIDMLKNLLKGLYCVSVKSTEYDAVYKHLTDKLKDCKTTKSLEELKNEWVLKKTVLQSLLSEDGDELEFKFEKEILRNIDYFGTISVGGKEINIEADESDDNNAVGEISLGDCVQLEASAVSEHYSSTNTETNEESYSETLPEMPAVPQASNAGQVSDVNPTCSSTSSTETANTCAASSHEVISNPSSRTCISPVQRAAATQPPLTPAPSVPTTPAAAPRVALRQNELPRNVNYQQKRSCRKTILGRCDNPSLRLKQPWGSVYSMLDDSVYVADTGNDRIMVYDVRGTRAREFYRVEKPTDVTISDDERCVLVLTSTAVHIVNRSGQLSSVIDSFQRGRLKHCISIATKNNNIVILDCEEACIIFYDLRGNYLRHIRPSHILSRPQSIAIDGRDQIYVANMDCVCIFGWSGQFVKKIFNTCDQDEDDIISLFVDGDGIISVARTSIGRIEVYGRDYQRICTYGRKGKGPGCLKCPTQVRLMPSGRAIVTEFNNDRVQIF